MVEVFRDFGVSVGISPDRFLIPRAIVRMGNPPNRLEVTTYIDGVDFAECYQRRNTVLVQGEPVHLISLADLRKNKAAAGRAKDLADLENLPEE